MNALRTQGAAARFLGVALGLCLALFIGGCETEPEPGPSWPAADGGSDGAQCTPQCAFKACGDDGCGGACGSCGDGFQCLNFACIDDGCTPHCGVRVCGEDGCGGSCGACGVEELCTSGECIPDDGVVTPDALDGDKDGVPDAVDNCATVYNPTQVDLDADFIGDVCDPDIDNDGALNDLDCAPADPTVGPFTKEFCGDGVDNNCNGATDEADAYGCIPYFVDTDGDKSGPTDTGVCLCAPDDTHTASVGGDCDPSNPAISPLAAEACDGIDNNCNLLIDEGCDDDGDGYCDAAMTLVEPLALCPNGGGDCQDYFASVNPGGDEIADDGIDNDCDGTKLEPSAGTGEIKPECPALCFGKTVPAFLCAMEICYPGYVGTSKFSSPTSDPTGTMWNAIPHYGSPSNDLDVFTGPSYAIMGTGNVSTYSHQDTISGGFGKSDPVDTSDEMNDAIEFTVTLTAPPGATGFSIDYIFMSAEYHEWVGSSYNDRFYIKMKAPVTTGNKLEVINYASCENPGSYYDAIIDGSKVCYIAINAAFSEPCPSAPTNLAGTGHDCGSGGSSTGWLTTTWPVAPGETFQLVFHIHDTSDETFDSTVLIDNFKWQGGTIDKGTDSHN